MRILDRYLVREFLGPFFLAISAFVIIMLSGQLFWLMDLIIIKRIAVLVVVRMLLYSLPGIVAQVLPMAVLFATILGLGRLARDSELAVLRIAGAPFPRIALPLIIIGGIVTAGTFYLSESVAPWATHESETLVRQMVLQEALPSVEENIFFRAPDDRYFYIGKVDADRGTMQNVMVYEVRKGTFPRLLTAKRGEVRDLTWVLFDGSLHDLDRSGRVTTSMSFETLEILMDTTLDRVFSGQKTTAEMSMRELGENIRLFERSGIKVESLRVDYYMKVAQPFAALVLAVLGSSLVTRSPRKGGSYFGIVLGALVSLSYFVIQAIARSVGARGILPPLAAAWVPNVLFFVPGVLMLVSVDSVRMPRRRPWAGLLPHSGGGAGSMILLLASLLVCLASAPISAGESYTVRITADRVTYDGHANSWTVAGNVVITLRDVTITGDRAEVDLSKNITRITGGVEVVRGEETLRGEVVFYNMSTGDTRVEKVRAKLRDQQVTGYLYLAGEEFTQKEDYYRLDSGYVTTCDLDTPHFRIEAREMEVYADDRIVLRHVSYYEGNIKLLSWPRVVIPLREDERFELPKVGYGFREGWYVKTKYNYTINENAHGSFLADYFQLLGPAVGVTQKLALGSLGSMSIHLYQLWNQATATSDNTAEFTHSVDLPFNLTSQFTYSYKDYVSLSAAPTEETGYDLRLDRKTDTSTTSLRYSHREVDSASHNTNTSATLLHNSTLPLEVRLSADALYRRQVSDDVETLNVLNYRVSATRAFTGFNVAGLAQSQVYFEEEDDQTWEKPEPPPWKALSRLPEISVTTDRLAIPNTPLRASARGLLGRYTEDAVREGVRSEVTLSKGEADVQVFLDQRPVFRGVTVDARARGVAGLYEDFGARVGLGYTVGATATPFPGTSLRVTFNHFDLYGESPFLFDTLNAEDKLSATLTSRVGPLRLSLTSGYGLLTGIYDTVAATAQITLGQGITLDLTGKYDLNTLAPVSLVGKLVAQPSPQFQFRAAGSYDFSTSRLTRVESTADFKLTPDWRLQWAAVYDVAKNGFTRGDIGVTRDLHCREVSVMYQYTTNRIWLEFRYKAFPTKSLGFGLGEEGVLFGTKGPF